MNETIQSLLIDHDHMRKMLTCFEAQLDTFERAEQPDYEILADSLAYCREYLDQWHHPREDAMFDLLQMRDAAKAASLKELEGQHKNLAAATVRVVGIFKDVAERGAVYLREDLVNSGRELSGAYKHHLNWEEANFFPVVEEVLESADWQSLSELVAVPSDPLAANLVDSRYGSLLRVIAAM